MWTRKLKITFHKFRKKSGPARDYLDNSIVLELRRKYVFLYIPQHRTWAAWTRATIMITVLAKGMQLLRQS
jgi:hypothetical protein